MPRPVLNGEVAPDGKSANSRTALFLKSILPLLLLIGIALPVDGAAQQYEVPFPELMAGPADGVAYHETRLRAQQLISAEDYPAAEPLVEQVARDYPRDGLNWLLLGQTKAGLGKHAEAGAAYERAAEVLGWNDSFHLTAYHAIANHIQAGNETHALNLLRSAIFDHRNFYLRSRAFGWNIFAGYRENADFLRIVGRVGQPEASRGERWVQDIDYLVDEVRRVNPDYHDAPFPAEFTRRYLALRSSAADLSDEEMFVGMNHLLAALRQGHLSVFPPAGSRHLPMQFYAFPEGVYIVAADSPYASLAGARVVQIGDVPVAQVLRRLAEVRSAGSDAQHLWGVSDISSAYYLKGTNIIGSTEFADLIVERPGGNHETVRVATTSEPPRRRLDKLVPPPGVSPPLFLRDADQSHWAEALPEHDALYVQVNQVRPDPDETLPEFGRRLADVLDHDAPTNLIIDIRHNNGGDTSQYLEFLRTVIAFSRDPARQVYVLIGRRVFSAAANLVTDLERLADPVFVGEATSACCSFTGDPSQAILPNSGFVAELTAVRWNLSYNQFDVRREMQPEVPVQLTARAYFAGEDPALEAVFRLIHEGSGVSRRPED